MTKAEKMIQEVEEVKSRLSVQLTKIVEELDFWQGLVQLDTVKGTKFQIQVRSADHQRGGGGKRTKYEYEGVVYESGKALCDHLGIDVAGDSAPRKIERYKKDNPEAKIEIVQ